MARRRWQRRQRRGGFLDANFFFDAPDGGKMRRNKSPSSAKLEDITQNYFCKQSHPRAPAVHLVFLSSCVDRNGALA